MLLQFLIHGMCGEKKKKKKSACGQLIFHSLPPTNTYPQQMTNHFSSNGQTAQKKLPGSEE